MFLSAISLVATPVHPHARYNKLLGDWVLLAVTPVPTAL